MTSRPAMAGVTQRMLIGGVRLYRLMLSPWLGSSCRFVPTCSAYAIEALECHGAAVGSYLTLGRLLRCQPWCPCGLDPVPTRHPFIARRSAATQQVVTPRAELTDKKLP